ncbi:hypothetical protein [Arthrobacter sp.]|uniref:hypothetical protein n=1 Tax=Arthrobacter sp. TaxID=1667 RepID=UPI00289F0D2E|nr:hypothetical protein [Arthrobacter sp.]
MKKWKKSSKVLFWFTMAIIAFVISRLLLPPEFAVAIAAIPGFLFVGYMANLGAQMARNPGPAPKNKEDDDKDG